MRALECSGPCPSWPCGSSSDEAARLPPLRLRAREELVDDHLRAVREVAELRLPHHERAVLRHRVAELEAQHGGLREQRVVDLEADARGRDAARGTCSCCVCGSCSTAWRCEKVPRCESWPESRTWTPSSSSVPQASDSAVAQSTSPLPSRSSARFLDEGHELGVHREALGQGAEGREHGLSRARIAGGSTAAGGRASRLRDGRERSGGGRHLGGHLGLLLGPQPVQLLAREDALAHELVAVERRDRGVRS